MDESEDEQSASTLHSTTAPACLDGFMSAPGLASSDYATQQARRIWPGIDFPSDFCRFNALQLTLPTRHMITCRDPGEGEEPVLSFLAFSDEMPHTTKYIVEKSAEYPPRWRVSRPGKKTQRRDVSNWKASGEFFFAYSTAMPGTTAFHLDWQTAPDRYVVSDEERPKAMLTRCLSFYAFRICQIYVLRHVDFETYKLVRGPTFTLEQGWKVTMSFYALDEYIAGTNRYYVQYSEEPFYRTRVAMTQASYGSWKTVFSFCAFDLPIAGCAKYSVFQGGSLPAYSVPEQYKIATGLCSGLWMWRGDFYAFPAKKVITK